MAREFNHVLVIEEQGMWVRFYDKIYRTGFIVSVSDDIDFIKKSVNAFLLEFDKKGEETVESLRHGWEEFESCDGMTWWLDSEFLIVIAVEARERNKIHEIQQTVLHELMHGAYRSLDFNGVNHHAGCHEHFVLYFDRLCSEVVPALWEWFNHHLRARREVKVNDALPEGESTSQ